MTTELHNTAVNMEGLFQVLGKNLYSTPAVAIRELVQNAHDACVRRKLEDKNFDNSSLKIVLKTESSGRFLTIEDNGSGLTKSEILDFLATIGKGYTRVSREATQNNEMIGYFGLGFLSAYVVADCVEVWSTSYQSIKESWYFKSAGGQRFSLSPTEYRPVGTLIRLTLSDKYRELGEQSVLISLLSKYCCLLPISIYIEGQKSPVNDLSIPWRTTGNVNNIRKRKQVLAFARHFETNFEPLYAFEIPRNERLGVEGVLWIQAGTGFETSDFRNVSVFVRNMHITSDGRDLLPNWAGFVGCTLSTVSLTPTASREDLQKDATYHAIKAYLEQCLIDGLHRISQSEPETWRALLNRHNQALLGAAIAEPRLFEVLQAYLTVPTSQGDMTLTHYVKQTKNSLYIRSDDLNNYEEVLFKAKKIPVILGYRYGATGFAERFAAERGIQISYLGSNDASNLYQPSMISEVKQSLLETLFVKEDEMLVVGRFEPDYVPLLIIEDKDVKLKKRIEQDEVDKRIGAAALMLAKLHTSKTKSDKERKVIVNMNNRLVSQMLERGELTSQQQQAASIVRSFMVSVCFDSSSKDLVFSDELKSFFENVEALVK